MIQDREFILGFHGYWEVDNNHYFVYEYCLWGDVRNTCNVKPGKVLSQIDSNRMIQDLHKALTHLYSMNIVHRNIKLSNIW